tara:strand:- start:2669 stop:3973 length:1305 start_codon:yes stop_codon:yes gene_type:complete
VKKVLLLTYYWPPSGGPGVQRWLKNAVFLRDFGWDCIVITPKEPVASSTDLSLLNEVPDDMRVLHTKAKDPFKAYALLKGKKNKSTGTGGIGISSNPGKLQKAINYIRANFFIPDARKGWNPYLIKEARRVLKEEKIEAIISTGPPHSTHLAAMQLQKEFDLPWLADFRDPWVNIFYNQFFPRTKSTQAKDQAMENEVLKTADRILTVSPGLAKEFEDRAKKVEILYNGFDPKDLPSTYSQKSEKFRISYTGNFKPNQNVEALWQGLAKLIKERTDFAQDFQLEIVGNLDSSIRESIENAGLSSCLKDHGYQAHHYATQVMVDSNALLFIVPQTKDNHLILTGKLFEYLGSGTPLISIAPPKGNAAKIIAETERGPSIDYTDHEGIKNRILSLYKDWKSKSGELTKLSSESTLAYTRKGSTQKLAQTLDQISKA